MVTKEILSCIKTTRRQGVNTRFLSEMDLWFLVLWARFPDCAPDYLKSITCFSLCRFALFFYLPSPTWWPPPLVPPGSCPSRLHVDPPLLSLCMSAGCLSLADIVLEVKTTEHKVMQFLVTRYSPGILVIVWNLHSFSHQTWNGHFWMSLENHLIWNVKSESVWIVTTSYYDTLHLVNRMR